MGLVRLCPPLEFLQSPLSRGENGEIMNPLLMLLAPMLVQGLGLPSQFASAIPTIIALAPQIGAAAQQGAPAVKELLQSTHTLLPALEALGKQLFPDVPTHQAPLAVATAFDHGTVVKVQAALNGLGSYGVLTLDGVLGDVTKKAVTAYQTAKGLTADGWPGPVTQKALGV